MVKGIGRLIPAFRQFATGGDYMQEDTHITEYRLVMSIRKAMTDKLAREHDELESLRTWAKDLAYSVIDDRVMSFE